MSSKGANQRHHARVRHWQRVGVELSRTQYRQLIRDLVAHIASGDPSRARCIKRQSIRVGVFRVQHNGTSYNVVYDRDRKNIVTFLTDAMVEIDA